jgi:hypothetical protein
MNIYALASFVVIQEAESLAGTVPVLFVVMLDNRFGRGAAVCFCEPALDVLDRGKRRVKHAGGGIAHDDRRA